GGQLGARKGRALALGIGPLAGAAVETMRMRLSRPLKPRKERLQAPRLPCSEQAELWQKKGSMPRLDASAMTQPLGEPTRWDTSRSGVFSTAWLPVKPTTGFRCRQKSKSEDCTVEAKTTGDQEQRARLVALLTPPSGRGGPSRSGGP